MIHRGVLSSCHTPRIVVVSRPLSGSFDFLDSGEAPSDAQGLLWTVSGDGRGARHQVGQRFVVKVNE
jgi:hypothetical protein